MDTFRLILLILGIMLIGGMFLYHRFTSDVSIKWPSFANLFAKLRRRDGMHDEAPAEYSNPATGDDARWHEPSVEDIAALSQLTPESQAAVDTSAVETMSALSAEELNAGQAEPLVMVLNIMAGEGQSFQGSAVLAALQQQDWRYGVMNIFHFFVDASPETPLCSIANIIEPGKLEPDTLANSETPGLSLFMQLPGPLEGREAFEQVVQLARTLTEQLGGELCDDTRSVLTMQTIGHLKEQIEAFRFKQKMAAIKHHRH